MKQLMLLLIATAFATSVRPQVLPDGPEPVPAQPEVRIAGQAMWDRMERLPRNQKIKIRLGNGQWERCTFAGATEGDLSCAFEDDSGYVHEWQVNRLNIAEFKLDHDVRNGRLIVTAMAVTGGLWAGIASWKNSKAVDAEDSGILGGLIGTGIGALVGVPLSCFSGHCVGLPNVHALPPVYAFRVNVPVRGILRHVRR